MNFTDLDRRIPPARDGFIAGYNGQIALDCAHGAHLTGPLGDRSEYIGRNIWIAFPAAGGWYLAPHDEMVRT